jgi:hypothetical protein
VRHCLLASSEFSAFFSALSDKPAAAHFVLLEALKICNEQMNRLFTLVGRHYQRRAVIFFLSWRQRCEREKIGQNCFSSAG